MKKNERVKRDSNFSRACTAIYTLQTSLDFEKGGNLAIQLFQVYEFCRQQIIKNLTAQDETRMKKAINTITEILDAWKMMPKEKT